MMLFRRTCAGFCLGLLLVGCGQSEPPKNSAKSLDRAEPKVKAPVESVELRVAKFAELAKIVEDNQGKVVVVDLWATWCVPCKKEFPHLVELHLKYQSKGVACVSVSLDDVADKAAALKFLQAQKATFPNVLLDESIDACQEKWDFTGIPVVLVYGPDGSIAKRFRNLPDSQFTYADVEKFVVSVQAMGTNRGK